MTATDWFRYRKCPQCFALIGESCLSLSGLNADGSVFFESPVPHARRKLRSGASENGDD